MSSLDYQPATFNGEFEFSAKTEDLLHLSKSLEREKSKAVLEAGADTWLGGSGTYLCPLWHHKGMCTKHLAHTHYLKKKVQQVKEGMTFCQQAKTHHILLCLSGKFSRVLDSLQQKYMQIWEYIFCCWILRATMCLNCAVDLCRELSGSLKHCGHLQQVKHPLPPPTPPRRLNPFSIRSTYPSVTSIPGSRTVKLTVDPLIRQNVDNFTLFIYI